MPTAEPETWITQAEYAKRLRPLLPKAAFQPSHDRILIVAINLCILLLGWTMARHLDRWPWPWQLLFLPFAMIMGNSIVVLLFGIHDVLHSSIIKHPQLRQLLCLTAFSMLWMPPTLWKAVHNREHHGKTNSVQDPDRNYLFDQPDSWGKWIQNLFVPSIEVNPFWMLIGMTSAWGVYAFRNLTSILLFNNTSTRYLPSSFVVSERERRSVAIESAAIVLVHASILLYIGFQAIPLILGYFLPIWLGYSILISYIYTNHLACRMTVINDPLINSLSVRVPKIFDLLHLNFSFHTEHHIFPGLNSDYYPIVQELLLKLYPDRLNLLGIDQAWQLLLSTPRHYRNDTTLTTRKGDVTASCPLPREQCHPHAAGGEQVSSLACR